MNYILVWETQCTHYKNVIAIDFAPFDNQEKLTVIKTIKSKLALGGDEIQTHVKLLHENLSALGHTMTDHNEEHKIAHKNTKIFLKAACSNMTV